MLLALRTLQTAANLEHFCCGKSLSQACRGLREDWRFHRWTEQVQQALASPWPSPLESDQEGDEARREEEENDLAWRQAARQQQRDLADWYEENGAVSDD